MDKEISRRRGKFVEDYFNKEVYRGLFWFGSPLGNNERNESPSRLHKVRNAHLRLSNVKVYLGKSKEEVICKELFVTRVF